MHARLFVALIPLAILATATEAFAQTLYRCGKTFQDRPCAAGEPSKIIGSGPAEQSAGPAQDPVCVMRGEQARKLMWVRETGKTRDDQLAAAKTQQERQLIEEIYLMRGNSLQVATMVRDKCIKEREAPAPTAQAAPGAATPPPAATPAPSASAATTGTADPVCASRGEQAKKIAWTKESGRTQNDQLASAGPTTDRQLIEEVYLLRGNSNEIAAAVVDRCIKERERQIRLGAAPAATGYDAPRGMPASSSSPEPTANLAPATKSEAEKRKEICRDYDADYRSIQDKQRTGGSAARMEYLREEMRKLDAARFSAGC